MARIDIREGGPDDTLMVLGWFDEAVAWLTARGQAAQWGAEPFSTQPRQVERVRALTGGGGLRIAELDGEPAGALAIGDAPDYAPPVDRPELYVILLLTSRRLAGHRIGDALVARAAAETARAGRALLRVDCWAGAPRLVRWYEEQGFTPTETFTVHDWTGQVFAMPVPAAQPAATE